MRSFGPRFQSDWTRPPSPLLPASLQNVRRRLDLVHSSSFFFPHRLWLLLDFFFRCFFVFSQSTQHVGFFFFFCLQNHVRSYWLFGEMETNVLFLWTVAEEQREKMPSLSSLTSPLVEVCVYVRAYTCVCVFLCANRQPAEAAEGDGSRTLRVETLYSGHLSVRRVFFLFCFFCVCVCPLLFFSLRLTPLSTHHDDPLTPPLAFPVSLLRPLQHTSKEREKNEYIPGLEKKVE